MRIDVWSDVVCPWCYIGKRRLEKALAAFPHADEVEVVWHSYQLDPGAPTEPVERSSDMLARKYGGGPAAIQQMQDRVEAAAAEEGLRYRLGETWHVNTVDAHRLLHAALHDGGAALQGRLKEGLLAAYFLRAENVADHEVLTREARSAGLAAERVADVLGSTAYAREVEDDMARAQSYGASGVPFVVVDERFAVSGAQPPAVFAQALERAWPEKRPALQTLGADEAEACGPDGCAL